MNEIRLLHNEDLECQIPQDILVEKEQNTDLQNSGSKRKPNYPSNLDMDNKNSGSKRQRRPSTTFKDHYVLNTYEINLQEDLTNFKEAVSSHDAEKWTKNLSQSRRMMCENSQIYQAKERQLDVNGF